MVRWVFYLRTSPQLRLGQALFNAAEDCYPEWVTPVRGVEGVDPFHNNENISAFLLYLEEAEREQWRRES